jgi:hypothetical protein
VASDRQEARSAAFVRLWLLDKLVGLWCWWRFG